MQVPAAPDLVAAVLVGGRSRRMGGRAKATLSVGGRSVLERVLDAVDGAHLPACLVEAHPEAAAQDRALAGLLDHLQRPRLRDRQPGLGPLSGLDAVFAATGARRVLLLACDLPFLTAAFLDWLPGQVADSTGAVPASEDGRLHPLCAAYDAGCRPVLAAALAARRLRVRDFVRDAGVRIVPATAWRHLDPEGHLLTNVNEPADMERAAAIWAARPATGVRSCRSPSGSGAGADR